MQNIKVDDILSALEEGSLKIGKDNYTVLRELIHEAWMHHFELKIELENLRKVLELKNNVDGSDTYKKNILLELKKIIYDINVNIRILRNRYYRKFELSELDKEPLFSTVNIYIEINSQLMNKLSKLSEIIRI